MEVILLEKVANLGNLGDRVKVKPGYGRNYLIPKGKATETTAENIARVEARRAELESRAAESLASAQARAKHMALVPASGYLADSVAIPARQAIELLLNFQVFDF